MNEQAVATIEQAQTALDMKSQVQRIQEVMQAVMKNGTHYGKIPGCGDKPALLKPGAEKLMMTFRLAVNPRVVDMSSNGVVRYRVLTDITAQSTGLYLGTGVGECSSDEEKYAWRKAVCREEWDEADPDNRRSKWSHGKNSTAYQIHQIRTNPSDVSNTVLKMAKKRSLVDGVLTVTGASDIFSQDLDEVEDVTDDKEIPTDPNEQKLQQAKTEQTAPATGQGHPIKYGPHAGKTIDDPSVSIADLQDMMAKTKAERFKAAVQQEIERRSAPQGDDEPAWYADTAAWIQTMDQYEMKQPAKFVKAATTLGVKEPKDLTSLDDRKKFLDAYATA